MLAPMGKQHETPLIRYSHKDCPLPNQFVQMHITQQCSSILSPWRLLKSLQKLKQCNARSCMSSFAKLLSLYKKAQHQERKTQDQPRIHNSSLLTYCVCRRVHVQLPLCIGPRWSCCNVADWLTSSSNVSLPGP